MDTINTIKIKHSRILNDIMRSAQLAAALEVSGWPKPGNVHRTANYSDVTFEQIIASSIAIGPANREAGFKGLLAGLGKIKMKDIGIGQYIKNAVIDFKAWQKNGNTHLGVCLLFIPLSAGAGFTFTQRQEIEPVSLRRNVKRIMKDTTLWDAIEVAKAIKKANPAGLGQLKSIDAPDLTEKEVEKTIVEREQTLFDLMSISAQWDTISQEWVTGMRLAFEIGYPMINRIYHETGNINTTTVTTFLTLLSQVPDTFIARKVGVNVIQEIPKAVEFGLVKAKEVSQKAATILQLGGLETVEGKKALVRFDQELRVDRRLNPGTTADLTAASLFIAILCGLRP
jgi:triphosphoribosyl-dephospho-CoA synthase